MLVLRKTSFKTKNIYFEKCHNAGNCEIGDPLRFFNIHSVEKVQKIEKPFGDFKKFSEKKTENDENFEQSHSAKKSESGNPSGIFNIHSIKIEGGPLGTSKKIRKKSHKTGKGGSLIVPKKLERGPYASKCL